MKNNRVRQALMLLSSVLFPAMLAAQGTGRVTGRVFELERGTPLRGAIVTIVGTELRATTTVDGRYIFLNVPEGTISIRAITIGFTPKTITGIVVKPGEATTQDIALPALVVQIAELTVTASVETGTVRAALDEQRSSAGIVNAISAQQMERSPDGDASAATQRLSGATIEDGRTPNMRGLGSQYTTSSLDGARIPSSEPERRTVPLDMIPSSLLAGINVQKTYSADLAGDFAGGSINITLKDFTGLRYSSFSISSGFNSAVTGSTLNFAPNSGRDWLALGSSARALPSLVASTDFSKSLSGGEVNSLINSFRRSWSVRNGQGGPNSGFGMSVGGTVPGSSNRVGYLLATNYSYTQETRAHEERAQAQPASSADGEVTAEDRYTGTTGRTSVLWGGIGNFGLTLGSGGKLSFHNMYNRTMDNEGRNETGLSEKLSYPLEIQRLRYVERGIYSSQLAFHQNVGDNNIFDVAVTLSGASRKEPDRSEIVYEVSTGRPQWLGFSNEAAVRTYGELKEHSEQATASWQHALGNSPSRPLLSVGVLYRTTDRVANNRAFSITLRQPLGAGNEYLTPEELFDGRFTQDAETPVFQLAPTSAGGSYTASDRLTAAYASMVSQLTSKLEVTGGLRVERSQVEVSSLSSAYEPSLANPRYTDFLPTVTANYHFGERTNLRLSVSQTLARPEYRELSPVTYREVLGQDNIRGNADLKRTLIQNYDMRWEFYPSHSEVLSIAGFMKTFDNPVERVYLATSDQRVVSFVNALGARNVGVELEARKELGFLATPLQTFTAFANLTLMHSRIRLDPNATSVTHSGRPMVGQAPYVVNAGLTWTHPTADASATLLFNRVGARISDAGEIPLPDVIEQPRSVVDVSVLVPIFGSLRARVDGRNLLDAQYLKTQGAVTREAYQSGRVFRWGLAGSSKLRDAEEAEARSVLSESPPPPRLVVPAPPPPPRLVVTTS